MRTLGAIAVRIRTFVVVLCDGNVENPFRFLNLQADLGQVGNLERRSVLLDDIHEVDAVEVEVMVNNFKSFLGEVKSLFYEVAVCVLHLVRCSEFGVRSCRIGNLLRM